MSLGFGGGALGRAVVEILGEDLGLKATLAEDEAALKSFSRTGSSSMSGTTQGAALANKAILGIGVAAVGVAAASVGMAVSFDKTFAQIGSLAGKLGMPLDQAKQHVLDLARATGQDPNGLAQALYFAASAGLQASQVMPVLDASAKAAAIGMGDAQTVAQTLTSVLNAYKGTGLDTAGVMNIMTAAVKDGKAEMSDFATGLGPIISVAAAAGVSFQDMAAALAEATNQGVPFSRAVTGLRFLISSLEAPTAKASTALQSIGLSAGDVAKMLTQPGGLEKAIQLIHDRTSQMGDAGRTAWAAITGGARGSIVAVDLVGKHAADTNRIVADLGRSAQKGATDFADAYKNIAASTAVKLAKTVAGIKADMIELGQRLEPLALELGQVFGGLLHAVIPLAPAILAFFLAFKGAEAAVAAMKALNFAISGLSVASGVMPKIVQAIAGLSAPEIALGIADIAVGLEDIHLAAAALSGDTAAFEKYTRVTKGSADSQAFFNKILFDGINAEKDHRRALGAAVTVANQARFAHSALTHTMDSYKTTVTQTGATLVTYGSRSKSAAGQTNALANAHRNAAAAATSQFLSETSLAGGVVGVAAAEMQARQGEQNLIKLRAQGKQGTQAYAAAQLQQAQNVLALAGAVSTYEKDNTGATGSMKAQLGPLAALFREYGLTSAGLDHLAGSAAGATSQVDAVATSVNRLPTHKDISINVHTTYTQSGNPTTKGPA